MASPRILPAPTRKPYGMGILPCNGMGVEFMSPEFLKHYKVAVDEACRRNAKGGKAWFLPSPGVAALKAVLTEALPDGDVVIEQDRTLRGGNLSYIHKVKDGQSRYFFANSSDVEADTWVALRGKVAAEIWNPHDGKIAPAEVEHVTGKEGPVTRVQVKLAPVRSLFLVAADTESMK